jgi:flagellar protein FliS
MLYDGVIRFMQQAKEAIRDKRIEDRYKALTKASEVIMGLQGCLDFENAGEIARLLYGFYSNIDWRIFSVHRSNSIETCDEIIAELKTMRDVWHEIDRSGANAPSTSALPPLPAAEASGDKGILTA